MITRRLWYLEALSDQMEWKAIPFVDKFLEEILSLDKIQFRSDLLGRIVVSLMRKFEIYNYSNYRYTDKGFEIQRENRVLPVIRNHIESLRKIHEQDWDSLSKEEQKNIENYEVNILTYFYFFF